MLHKHAPVFEEEVDGEGIGEEVGGSAAPQEPSYLFGDVTAEEAAERFGFLRELPDRLRGMESRVQDAVNPVMEQLKGVQEKVGTQPVFQPKLERVQAALDGFDPELARKLVPALLEDLQGSMSVTPIGKESLEPHINPMLEALQQQLIDQMIPVMLDSLPYDSQGIVNRDPQDPDKVLPAQTSLQKDFATWWEQADAPTRQALSNIGLPYVQALQRFGKWRAERLKGKGEAAGEASARLTSAAQQPKGGARQESPRQLTTEEDGYRAYLASRRG